MNKPQNQEPQDSPKWIKWINELRTTATKKIYSNGSRKVLGNEPDEWLSKTLEERKTTLTRFIQRVKDKVSALTLEKYLRAVKAFADEYRLTDIAWKQILRKVPERKREASDRIATIEEIRDLLEVLTSFRDKAMPLVLKSSGARIGAIPSLKLCDYTKITIEDKVIARLTIYRGSAEEYYSFVDPETVKVLESMLEERRQAGEDIPELETLSPEELTAKEEKHIVEGNRLDCEIAQHRWNLVVAFFFG